MDLHNRSVRQDVRELGALLGDVVSDHSPPESFELVESARNEAIAYRRGRTDDREPLTSVVGSNSEAVNAVLARSFTIYFQLINLAEERERVRALRTFRQQGTISHSITEAMENLAEAGADAETVGQVLSDVHVVPTFTAHPTEARRKTVKGILQRVGRILEDLDERRLTNEEETALTARLNAVVESLYTTKHIRDRRPEPFDEARNVQWYLDNVIFDVIPEIYAELEAALEENFEDPPDPAHVLEFRSWAGSDADGNPNVTPEVTDKTLHRQRSLALARYREALEDLLGVLSQDGTRVDVETYLDTIMTGESTTESIAETAAERYPREPFRQATTVILERVDRVESVRPGGYEDGEALLEDLSALAEALSAEGLDSIVSEFVTPLKRQVQTFGFHLASLDLRDHRQQHTQALSEALGAEDIDYAGMDESERQEFLTEAITRSAPVLDLEDRTEFTDETAVVLERFDRLADWHEEFGPDSIDAYCISMTEEPSHVLEVLFLADQAGVVDYPDYSGLDVVPLLETESALSNARDIIGTLFENEAYGAAMRARDETQEIMLGYSDSNKENGYLAANWQLDRAQRRLAEITDDYGVELRLFHGRGGTISRGGGPMNDALLALPKQTVTGEVKFTQQGEAISEKYGNARIARREMGQMLNAQIRARHANMSEPDPTLPEPWVEAMDEMADTARETYRSLLETEGFVSYFEQTTPIKTIEGLNLGSRPASRSDERNVEDLRAIPWVFAWTQSRAIIPGWFGIGSGIDAYLAETDDGLERLKAMYESWPFFQTMLDNAALSLARTEMEIASEYATLADDDLQARIFPAIENEYERSKERVLDIIPREDLVDRSWLRESLDRRNPYVDPLNFLQIQLLSRSHRTPQEERTLRLTVKGIAAGMKNTG
ncbi:phosphoenolpyruvate carboxylase [Halodesulfurarchaeum formicicum]|uniref:phosphoenolpyruvate carboxylase n=1 Tax=Halodesulfurarchaeum formicicum TaxID=1873524 RepID=A0A1J1ADX0_9EURY|nr:phosphoenolpyruvate carboxylase [Halodesulfurarchaeum formicicum]APE95777.1 phosphoenolpyruvate carboxylase [Halodesulfurarchaeum formicicum]